MTIDWFYTVYPNIIDGLLVVIALIGIFFIAVLVSFFVERNSQKVIKLTILTMFAFLSSMLTWSVLDHFKKKTFVGEVFELVNNSSTKVFVNGCLTDKEWLMVAMEDIFFIKKASGSRPTDSYILTLKNDSKELELQLSRDSRTDDMFWVSFPGVGGSPGEFYLIAKSSHWSRVSCNL